MTLIFGTVIKNIEGSIYNFHMFVSNIIKELPDAHICIYENNSTDKTCELLSTLKNLSPNVHIKTDIFSHEELLQKTIARCFENRPCRMEMISNARNELLKMIAGIGYQDNDLIIMFDGDLRHIPIEPLIECIKNFPDNVDAMFANGVKYDGYTYYDYYALRYSEKPFGPEIIGEEFWKTIKNISISEIQPVISAFGGLGIYKGYCVRKSRYSAIPTQSLNVLYKNLLKKQEYKQKLKTKDNETLGVYLFGQGEDDIFYLNNSGYNFPVVCEHSTFHADMFIQGYNRFIIMPKLKYYSNH